MEVNRLIVRFKPTSIYKSKVAGVAIMPTYHVPLGFNNVNNLISNVEVLNNISLHPLMHILTRMF